MASNPIKEALKRIDDEIQSQEDGPEELTLDSIHFKKFTPELTSKIEKYNELLCLSLNDCEISTLDNFPKLPNLIRLELTDNKINGKELSKLANLTGLQSLSLGGNPISQLDDLQVLKGLTKLIQLDLFGCPVSEDLNYRTKIFKIFSSLQILDNKDQNGVEVEYDDEDDDEEGVEGEDNDDNDDDYFRKGGEGSEDEEEEEEEDDDDDDDEDEDQEEDEDDEDDEDVEQKARMTKKPRRD